MGIIGWIVLGLIAGAIAKAILPGDDPGGIIVTIIIGIVGAILGGFLAQVLFGRDTVDEFFDISTWLTAIIGAILLLVIYRMVVGRGQVGAGSSSPARPISATRPGPGGASSRSGAAGHGRAGELLGVDEDVDQGGAGGGEGAADGRLDVGGVLDPEAEGAVGAGPGGEVGRAAGVPFSPARRRRPREETLLTTTLTGRRYWMAVSSSPMTLANPSEPVTAMQARPGWAHWAAMA